MHPPVAQLCPRFQAAMDVLGRPWTGLILMTLADAPLGFCELAGRIEIIGDRMLASRLKDLEARGIVERLVISEAPLRVAYRLTERGAGFIPVARALEAWGGALMSAPAPTGSADSTEPAR